MTREESIREMLARQAPGTRRDVMQIAVTRSNVGYDLWAPGNCSCGPPSHRDVTLNAAVQQILEWRPERKA